MPVSENEGARRRLEVAIPGAKMKVFAHAIQCLSKVGKELFIEGTSHRLILRTLNDAKSAFCAFYFGDNGFFETFRCDAALPPSTASSEHVGSQSQGSSRSVSCRVLIKAVHNILRSFRNILRLIIFVEEEDDLHIEPCLGFQIHCEHGVRKVHRFNLQDCDVMSALFDRTAGSRLTCTPGTLSHLFEYVSGAAEVAVSAKDDVFGVRSFHHEAAGRTRETSRALLSSAMSISSAEFEVYSFEPPEQGGEVELIFSLREVRALLAFCDQCGTDVLHFLFTSGGAPIMFSTQSNAFSVELILASMEPPSNAAAPTTSSANTPAAHANAAAAANGERAAESASAARRSANGSSSSSRNGGSSSRQEREEESGAAAAAAASSGGDGVSREPQVRANGGEAAEEQQYNAEDPFAFARQNGSKGDDGDGDGSKVLYFSQKSGFGRQDIGDEAHGNDGGPASDDGSVTVAGSPAATRTPPRLLGLRASGGDDDEAAASEGMEQEEESEMPTPFRSRAVAHKEPPPESEPFTAADGSWESSEDAVNNGARRKRKLVLPEDDEGAL